MKPIQGPDGRLRGSVGGGKAKVPTPSPIASSPAMTQPPSPDYERQHRLLDSAGRCPHCGQFTGQAHSCPPVTLPPETEAALAGLLGDTSRRRTVQGGYTPGVKFLAESADGNRFFVKSAVSDSMFGEAYRAEAEAHLWLPHGATRGLLVAHLDAGGRDTLVFHGLHEASPSPHRWTGPGEARLVLSRLGSVYDGVDSAAPAGLVNGVEDFWSRQEFWRDVAAGREETPDGVGAAQVRAFADLESRTVPALSRPEHAHEVAHDDLRRDNIIVEGSGDVAVLDWAWVSRTPRLVDAVGLGVDFARSGVKGDMVFGAGGPYCHYARGDADAVLAAMSGYYHHAARVSEGKPAGLVQAQREASVAATAWLSARLGL